MAFQFSLAAVLLFRESVEHQQELLLQESNQRVERLRREIESVDASVIALAQREAQGLDSGLSAAELQFDLLCRGALKSRRHALEQEMARAMHACALRRAAFRQARQQREILDTLKRQYLELYLLQETRQEQRNLDDMFLLRRAFLRRD